MDGGYGWVQAALEGNIFWGTMLLLAVYEDCRHLLHHQFRG